MVSWPIHLRGLETVDLLAFHRHPLVSRQYRPVLTPESGGSRATNRFQELGRCPRPKQVPNSRVTPERDACRPLVRPRG